MAGKAAVKRVIAINMGVREENNPPIGIGRDHGVGPVQNRVTRAKLKANQEPINSAGRKELKTIIQLVAFKHSAEVGPVLILAERKGLVEQRRVAHARSKAV